VAQGRLSGPLGVPGDHRAQDVLVLGVRLIQSLVRAGQDRLADESSGQPAQLGEDRPEPRAAAEVLDEAMECHVVVRPPWPDRLCSHECD
jgi:hypothetical protein